MNGFKMLEYGNEEDHEGTEKFIKESKIILNNLYEHFNQLDTIHMNQNFQEDFEDISIRFMKQLHELVDSYFDFENYSELGVIKILKQV